MNKRKGPELLVGILFLGSLGALILFTAILTGVGISERHPISVTFDQVAGLERGDPVRVGGLQIGRVDDIDWRAEDGMLLVVMVLDRPLTLRSDYAIRIEDATMLGGKVVTIEPGTPSAPPLSSEVTVQGTAAKSVFRTIGRLVEDNQDNLTRSLDGIRDIVEQVAQGRGTLGKLTREPEVADKLASLLGRLDTLARDLLEGKGILGGLLRDDESWQTIRGTLADIREIGARAARGEGTVGKLLQDDELYTNLNAASGSLASILERVERGEGTAGRFVTDVELYDNLVASAGRFRSLTAKLDEGDGPLAVLLNDTEAAANLGKALADLRAVMEKVRSGEGSLGRIIMDDELVDKVVAAVTSLASAIEDARETAPINTFTQALFSVF
jgi:phospholipid/cholesterol/gamma-HCH transport system substrate-binding protein